jgi:hypothetical protein
MHQDGFGENDTVCYHINLCYLRKIIHKLIKNKNAKNELAGHVFNVLTQRAKMEIGQQELETFRTQIFF